MIGTMLWADLLILMGRGALQAQAAWPYDADLSGAMSGPTVGWTGAKRRCNALPQPGHTAGLLLPAPPLTGDQTTQHRPHRHQDCHQPHH